MLADYACQYSNSNGYSNGGSNGYSNGNSYGGTSSAPYSNGSSYGGGFGGAGGDKMSNLGAGLKTQHWGKVYHGLL